MKTFTVHLPPPSGDSDKDALDTVFVREGFALWAFLIPLGWLLVHGMWLVLIGYLIMTGLLEGASYLFGDIAPGVFAFLITILFALEANSLRRWTLDRDGYRFVGVVTGRNLADAEQRFFDSWSNKPPQTTPAAPRMKAAPLRAGSPFGERPVTGLFPQSGTPR